MNFETNKVGLPTNKIYLFCDFVSHFCGYSKKHFDKILVRFIGVVFLLLHSYIPVLFIKVYFHLPHTAKELSDVLTVVKRLMLNMKALDTAFSCFSDEQVKQSYCPYFP